MTQDPPTSSRRARLAALAEVLAAFAVMHLSFRLFKRFTCLGQSEYRFDVNLSPGACLIGVALLMIWFRRRRPGDYGISVRNLLHDANVGLVSVLTFAAVALLSIAAGMRRDPTWTDPRLGVAACLLSLCVSGAIVWILRRAGGLLERMPRPAGAGFVLAITLFPIVVRLVDGRPVGHTIGAVLSIVFGAALAESVFFQGYVQSRLNEVYGRPWRFQGVAFGPGLLVAAGLFGLVHLLNTYDYLSGGGRLAWWWGAVALCSLYHGFLRERTGSIVATVVLHAFIDLASRGPDLIGAP